MKNAYNEALSRRKKGQTTTSDEEDRKNQDLAPEINDAGNAKLEIEIGLKHGTDAGLELDTGTSEFPPGAGFVEGRNVTPQEPNLATLMGKEPTESDLQQLGNSGKPRSLMEAAKKALYNKKG